MAASPGFSLGGLMPKGKLHYTSPCTVHRIPQSRGFTMRIHFPRLALVPTDALHPHEDHDPSRAEPLARRIREMGVFRDPPIVMPMPFRPGHYMVLDGANRTFACRLLGLPHILVQIVEADSPILRLDSWNHVIWEMPSEVFLQRLREALPWDLTPADPEEAISALQERQALLVLATPPERYYVVQQVEIQAPLLIEHLRRVVNVYLNQAALERTGLYDAHEIAEWFPQWTGLVVFPAFTVQEVFQVVQAGKLFPTGITRFMVSPRALRLYYPLKELAASRPLEEKNRRLQAWIHERLRQKGVRYYGDTTMLFDE